MTSWVIYKGIDRYVFPGNYVYQGAVVAANDDFKFEWQQEKGERYWRRKFSGKLVFKDDYSYHSYTILKDIYDSDERCDNLIIAYIKEGCVSAPDYNIYFKGFLNFINWEIDEDKRIITINTIDPFDEYSIITENLKTEHNILFAGSRVEAWAALDTHYQELDVWKPDKCEIVIQYQAGGADYYLIDHEIFFGVFATGGQWANWQSFGNGGTIWARDVKYEEVHNNCYEDTAHVDELISYGWQWIGTEEIDGKDYCKWIRISSYIDPVSGQEAYPWFEEWIVSLTFDNTDCKPTVPTEIPEGADSNQQWTLMYDGSEDGIEAYGWYPVNIWVYTDDVFIQKYKNCRYLKDVIEYMLSQIGFSGGYLSGFFDNDVNVMIPHGSCFNKRQYLLISHKSDIRLESVYISYDKEGRPDIDAATKGILSLKDLLEMLGIFNVHWYIDDDGYFRIEHEKYFHYGLNYLAIIVDINDDLTANQRALYKKKYTFDNEELFKNEKFIMMEQQNLDFVGEFIGYNDKCLNQENNDLKEWNFDNVTTDLKLIYEDVESISRDGFCLLSYLDVNGQPYVRSEIGKISGHLIVNGHHSWANLHHYYWTFDRSAQTGWMNFKEVTFDSWKMSKIQTEITIMDCCTWSFNPYKWYKTELGYGKVVKAIEDNKTGTLKLTLKYGA